MPVIEWTEQYNLKNEHFDNHHLHLIDLLNYAYDNFVKDNCLDGFTTTLNHFFHHVCQHFDVEEQYMANTEYAGYTEHVNMHSRFSEQVTIMQNDLKKRWKNLPLEMVNFLKNWLNYEICVADAEYVRQDSGNRWKQCA
jgi:hemerythrin-like metal-binding protein